MFGLAWCGMVRYLEGLQVGIVFCFCYEARALFVLMYKMGD